jgi:drug/metabolite transporter (DMT)-like permease
MKESSYMLTGAQIASVRIFSAGFVFLPFAIFHLRQIPKAKLPYVVLSGILGNLLPAFLFAIAIDQKVESSLAGILNSLTPLLVIVLGLLFFKAHINSRKIAGVLIGFVGLLILSLSKGGLTITNIKPALLILIATLCYGLNVNLVSIFLKGVDPIKMATVSLAFMLLPTAFLVWQQDIISMFRYDEGTHWPILAAVLLGVVGSAIATAFFYVLIKRAGGLFASLVTYGIPVVAILWGVWARENVTWIQVGCLVLILGGVYLANRNR